MTFDIGNILIGIAPILAVSLLTWWCSAREFTEKHFEIPYDFSEKHFEESYGFIIFAFVIRRLYLSILLVPVFMMMFL